jgi:hypothetical protein
MAATTVSLLPFVEKRLVARRPTDREHLIPAEIDKPIDALDAVGCPRFYLAVYDVLPWLARPRANSLPS